MNRVEQYREYREVGMELNSRMIESCLGDGTITESAELLGIKGGEEIGGDEDVLSFDREGDMDVLFDFALNENRQDGETAVEKFWEQELWESETEKEILDSLLQSYTSLFQIISIEESECLLVADDLLNEGTSIELIDIGFSGTANPGSLLFIRRVPFEQFSMTSGIAFPFLGRLEDHLLNVYSQVTDKTLSKPESVVRFATFYKLYQKYGIEARYK